MASKSWQKEKYWKNDDTAPCAMHEKQNVTILDKIELSTNVVQKAVYLIEQVNQAIEMPQNEEIFPAMLSFLIKANHVITRYCNYFELCDRVELQSPDELSVKLQIVIVADEVLYLLKLIKRCIGTFQSVRNPRAQDMCFRICKRLNSKFEQYLVNINYWVSQMSESEKQLYNLA